MDDRNNSDKPEASRVGYCNPPAHSRFQKGKSGNPKGRPKGTLNIATVLERTLLERVAINENGKRRTVTKLEAAFKQLTNKAAGGELKALQLLAALVRSAEERGAKEAAATDRILDEPDEKVFLSILKRIEVIRKGDREDETAPR